MLSIIIATDGQEPPAVATLAPLVPGASAGLIREVLLVDCARSDTIARVADVAGCGYFGVAGSRSDAFALGAAKARSPWLMFLCAGTVLDATWVDETAQFIQTVAMSDMLRAGVFTPARSPYARVRLRDHVGSLARFFGKVSADQGLLIARDHYRKLGGYDSRARDPEAALLRKLGRTRMQLRTRIMVT